MGVHSFIIIGKNAKESTMSQRMFGGFDENEKSKPPITMRYQPIHHL